MFARSFKAVTNFIAHSHGWSMRFEDPDVFPPSCLHGSSVPCVPPSCRTACHTQHTTNCTVSTFCSLSVFFGDPPSESFYREKTATWAHVRQVKDPSRVSEPSIERRKPKLFHMAVLNLKLVVFIGHRFLIAHLQVYHRGAVFILISESSSRRLAPP